MERTNLLPALGEGFKLIAREPLPVLAWGLVTLVAALVPALAYFAMAGSEMTDFYAEVLKGAAEGDAAVPPSPNFAAAGLVQLLQWVAALVSGAVVYAAVFRAVLRPEEKGFARMRFGMDELYVGIVMVVLVVLLIILLIAGAIVFAIPVGIGFAVAGDSGGGAPLAGLTLLVILGAMIGIAVLYSRFGMAMPMTFAERRIRIFEAWTFTKGYSGQLLIMVFLQIMILVGIYVAAIIAIGIAAAGTFIGMGPEALEGALSGGEVFQRFSGMIVVIILIYALLLFIMTPILLAPWAKAYQLIAADKLEGRTDVFS
jgi:hypothetical protein